PPPLSPLSLHDALPISAVLDLVDRLDPAAVVADGAGPVRSVNDALAGRPALAGRLRVLTTAEYASACGEFLADVRAGRIGHDGSDRKSTRLNSSHVAIS